MRNWNEIEKDLERIIEKLDEAYAEMGTRGGEAIIQDLYDRLENTKKAQKIQKLIEKNS